MRFKCSIVRIVMFYCYLLNYGTFLVIRLNFNGYLRVGPNIYEMNYWSKDSIVQENTRYTLRLRNQGGKTYNGDGGVGTVKGPDGTSFHLSACLLSYNGTNHVRGQFPFILYYKWALFCLAWLNQLCQTCRWFHLELSGRFQISFQKQFFGSFLVNEFNRSEIETNTSYYSELSWLSIRWFRQFKLTFYQSNTEWLTAKYVRFVV